MRGAPQRGLLRLIIRIFRVPEPLACTRPTWPSPVDFPRPKQAKAFTLPSDNCVGLDIISTDFQSPHTRRSQTQNIRSAGVSFSRLGADRCKTASCCRKARVSSRRRAEVLNIEMSTLSTVSSCSAAETKSKWKPINLNDCRSIRIFWRDNVFGYRWFGNLNAQLEQLAVNAWCTPARVVADQVDFPRPKQAKAFTLPSDNCVGLDIISTDFQSPHTRRSQTQNIRSAGVSFSNVLVPTDVKRRVVAARRDSLQPQSGPRS